MKKKHKKTKFYGKRIDVLPLTYYYYCFYYYVYRLHSAYITIFIQTNIFPFVIQLYFISIRMLPCEKRLFEKKTSKENNNNNNNNIETNAKDVGRKIYIIKMPLSIKHLRKQLRKKSETYQEKGHYIWSCSVSKNLFFSILQHEK